MSSPKCMYLSLPKYNDRVGWKQARYKQMTSRKWVYRSNRISLAIYGTPMNQCFDSIAGGNEFHVYHND